MPYKKKQKGGPVDKVDATMDYERVLFLHVNKMSSLVCNGMIGQYIQAVKFLEILLASYLDETYEDSHKENRKKYGDELNGADDDGNAKNEAVLNNAHRQFRDLMKLIDRQGFLPGREIEEEI